MNKLDINKAKTILDNMIGKKIDNKFIVVHPRNLMLVKKALNETKTYIEVYTNDYCDFDKVYFIDKN